MARERCVDDDPQGVKLITARSSILRADDALETAVRQLKRAKFPQEAAALEELRRALAPFKTLEAFDYLRQFA